MTTQAETINGSTDTEIALPPPDEIYKKAQGAWSDFNQLIQDAKAKIEEQLRAFNAAVPDIQTIATQASAARTQIHDAQAVIAAKSDHIQKAQEHADKVRGDLDRELTAAKQHVTETEAQKSAAESAAQAAAELHAQIRTVKGEIDSQAKLISDSKGTAEQSAEIAKALADKSKNIEERVAAYEMKLSELGQKCEERLKTIESLLPGAASAGLAHSFDERRKTFLQPQQQWQRVFVGSIVAIVLITLGGLWQVLQNGAPPTYDELFRLWLVRLPVVAALVWLALYSSRVVALSKRLEEDYGYKSATSACFEGFRRQMSDLTAETSSDSPLSQLCQNTLAIIATPPGRIYENNKLNPTPASEIVDAAKATAEVIKEIRSKEAKPA